MLFFASGASWAALGADLTLGKLRKCQVIWLPFIAYLIFISTLLVTIEFAPDVWLTRFICMLTGASLITNLIGSL